MFIGIYFNNNSKIKYSKNNQNMFSPKSYSLEKVFIFNMNENIEFSKLVKNCVQLVYQKYIYK